MNGRQVRQTRMAEETARVFTDLMDKVGREAGGPACLQAAATIVAASFTDRAEGDDYEIAGGRMLDLEKCKAERAAWNAAQDKAVADAQAEALDTEEANR